MGDSGSTGRPVRLFDGSAVPGTVELPHRRPAGRLFAIPVRPLPARWLAATAAPCSWSPVLALRVRHPPRCGAGLDQGDPGRRDRPDGDAGVQVARETHVPIGARIGAAAPGSNSSTISMAPDFGAPVPSRLETRPQHVKRTRPGIHQTRTWIRDASRGVPLHRIRSERTRSPRAPPPDIVPAQIHQHDVLGPLLGGSPRSAAPPPMRDPPPPSPPRSCARNRPEVRSAPPPSESISASCPPPAGRRDEGSTVRGGVHDAQRAVHVEGSASSEANRWTGPLGSRRPPGCRPWPAHRIAEAWRVNVESGSAGPGDPANPRGAGPVRRRAAMMASIFCCDPGRCARRAIASRPHGRRLTPPDAVRHIVEDQQCVGQQEDGIRKPRSAAAVLGQAAPGGGRYRSRGSHKAARESGGPGTATARCCARIR